MQLKDVEKKINESFPSWKTSLDPDYHLLIVETYIKDAYFGTPSIDIIEDENKIYAQIQYMSGFNYIVEQYPNMTNNVENFSEYIKLVTGIKVYYNYNVYDDFSDETSEEPIYETLIKVEIKDINNIKNYISQLMNAYLMVESYTYAYLVTEITKEDIVDLYNELVDYCVNVRNENYEKKDINNMSFDECLDELENITKFCLKTEMDILEKETGISIREEGKYFTLMSSAMIQPVMKLARLGRFHVDYRNIDVNYISGYFIKEVKNEN